MILSASNGRFIHALSVFCFIFSDVSFTISVIDDFISLNKIPLMITYSRETTPLILNSPLKLVIINFASFPLENVKDLWFEHVPEFVLSYGFLRLCMILRLNQYFKRQLELSKAR